jgi:hypothetical protein
MFADDDMFAEGGGEGGAGGVKRGPLVAAGLMDNYDDPEGYYNFQVGCLADMCLYLGLVGGAHPPGVCVYSHTSCPQLASMPAFFNPNHPYALACPIPTGSPTPYPPLPRPAPPPV